MQQIDNERKPKGFPYKIPFKLVNPANVPQSSVAITSPASFCLTFG
jgi:hypothetical protein